MSVLIDGRAGTRPGSRGSAEPGLALVARTALFERLSAAAVGGVVLVCAPAGSGKSVLVRSWVEAAGLQDRAVWVSVEREEREEQRFCLSVLESVARVTHSGKRLRPSPRFRGQAVVERLLSELDRLEEPVVLVIDDLHELRSPAALACLESLLLRMPPQVLVVLATREDPRLGLHRLRLAGELTELRGSDLSFSVAETRELLAASGIELSDAGVASLHERTEGWAAGLRLAAISLGQHPEPERFVREFSGSERTVAGYLLAEVLERQPADVRELLLRTSVLERVSGPLADYLTGGSGAERTLQELEDANAFVTALDAGRSWFRYHQLFADLLQLELRRQSPAIVRPLHRAAALWLEQEGYVVEAIGHAQKARDWPLASRLLADNHIDLLLDGRAGTICHLLSAFPEDASADDPELALVFAGARLLDGALDESSAYVQTAERLANKVPAERKGRFDLLLAELAIARARWRADPETALTVMPVLEANLAAQPAGERALDDDVRANAAWNLGVAQLWASRFDEAWRQLEEALALSRRAGRPWLEIRCLGHLGVAGPCIGRSFSAALGLSEEAVTIAEAQGWGEDPVVVSALAAGAMALLWLGRFEDAAGWIERAERVLTPDGGAATELVVHHARGLLGLARGRLEEARAGFSAAERTQALLVAKHAFVAVARARLLQTQVRMGEVVAARAALASVGEEERHSSNMRLAAAVIHLAESEPEQALNVLSPVIEGIAPAVQRASATIEAQVLDAASREQLGDRRGAEVSLERALDLAEPDGIVLPFVLAPVGGLLERLPKHRTSHATLLRAIHVLLGCSGTDRGGTAPLMDELSEAELRVVRYLPSNLKAPEIAAELYVSPNTVRTHIRHIYAKLDAHERNQAVGRARELGLLARSR
jgi:LuxR family transcriptional regulator, maltose regulon positive regulatory protein